MMLSKILLTIFSISTISLAQASQVSKVELSGTAASQSIQMMDQKFEPIMGQVPYPDTCYREVYDHTETVCSTESDQVCHGGGEECTTESDQVCNSHGCTTIPRRVCHQTSQQCESVPRRVCSDRAVTRTQAYSCTRYRTEQIGQRLVKTFQHSLEVAVDRPELLQGQRLVISLLAREDSITPTLVSSFSLNMLTVESQVSKSDSGSTEMIATRMMVHVGAPTSLIGKILSGSVQDLSLSSAGISLKINGVNELSQDLMIAVNLTQYRFLSFLIKDKTLFKDSIAIADLSAVAEGDSLNVNIPLSKMNIVQLKATRHNLSVSVSLKRPELSILNSTDLAAVLNKKLEASIANVTPN